MNAQPELNWEEIEERTRGPLRRVIEKQVNSIQKRIGASDIIQSAYLSLYRRRGQLRGEESNVIWKMLVTIANRKATSKRRHHTAAKRSIKQESPLDERANIPDPARPHDIELEEESSKLLNLLPEELRTVALMRLDEQPYDVVAEALGIAGTLEQKRNAIAWRLQRIQGIWKEYRDNPE
ncbi:MAG: sigma-70 family RNA polymerase sigma factor [Planctomycetales bacterium]|nr:sigma-70 family RNA polymerase sigma factor [Planctomycetales bacterium]